MNKSIIAVIALALLLLVTGGLYLSERNSAAANEAELAAQTAAAQAEQDRLTAQARELSASAAAAERAAQQALEAQRMAEARAAREEAERQRLVAELNERLERETRERREAELARQRLESRMAELAAAQQLAEQRLRELDAARTAQPDAPAEDVAEADTLRAELESQRNALAQLEQENAALRNRQDALLEQQLKTEEAILRTGARVKVTFPEMLSSNFRRRAVYHFRDDE